MVKGGDVERRSGAILAWSLTSFKLREHETSFPGVVFNVGPLVKRHVARVVFSASTRGLMKVFECIEDACSVRR